MQALQRLATLGILLASTLAAQNPSAPIESAAPSARNVLFLLADDMQWNAIGAMGNEVIRTPHLDRLAAQGTTWTRCYVQGSIHGAVCMPSRAMMITGRHLWRRGGDQVEGQLLWGEHFRSLGFETFVTGKWHNGPAALKRAFSVIGETGGGMLHSTPKDGDGYNRPGQGEDTWDPADRTRKGHWIEREGAMVHSSERWADQTIDFLRAHAGNENPEPFLAHLAFHAPHDPRQAPQEYLDWYPVDAMPLPPNYRAQHPFDNGEMQVRDEKLAPFPRTEFSVKTNLAEYYAIISHMDAQIGRVLAELDRLELTDETLVIFAADHGLAVGQHGLIGKQNLYEHSVRAPLIFKGPGVPAGETRTGLTYLHSIFPTACDWVGQPIPASVDARSLAPNLRSAGAPALPILCAGYRNLMRMATDGEWKWIVYPQSGFEQLFHLTQDPWEQTDLSQDPNFAEHKHRLRKGLMSWRKTVADPMAWPTPEPEWKPAPNQ